MRTKRIALGLTLGRDAAPTCLVVVSADRAGAGRAARVRVWPAGTSRGLVARHLRRLSAGRRAALAARPADARYLERVTGLEARVVAVHVPDAALAGRLYRLRRDQQLRLRVEGLEAELLQEELSDYPERPGGLVRALALAVWAASS